jgi:hypothetical protein
VLADLDADVLASLEQTLNEREVVLLHDIGGGERRHWSQDAAPIRAISEQCPNHLFRAGRKPRGRACEDGVPVEMLIAPGLLEGDGAGAGRLHSRIDLHFEPTNQHVLDAASRSHRYPMGVGKSSNPVR